MLGVCGRSVEPGARIHPELYPFLVSMVREGQRALLPHSRTALHQHPEIYSSRMFCKACCRAVPGGLHGNGNGTCRVCWKALLVLRNRRVDCAVPVELRAQRFGVGRDLADVVPDRVVGQFPSRHDLIVIGVAVGRAVQLAAENVPSRADTSEQAQPGDVVYAPGICSALDRYGNSPMTIDELHDLQDKLCPTLSEPQ